MSRKPHPRHRPPTRHDPRRPGSPPPRTPLRPRPEATTDQGMTGASEPLVTPRTARQTSAHLDAMAPGKAAHAGNPTPGTTPCPVTPAPATAAQPHRPRAAAPGTTARAPRPVLSPPTSAPTDRPRPQPRPTDLFADRLVAVLSGQRPVHWMLRHTAGQAYDDLARLAERNPLRAPGVRPVVSDLGYFVPRDGALEVFARVAAGDRLRALAFRLERGRDLRWRCTAVELAGPRPARGDTG
ncbi:Rv3235 family protein [Streptomyces sp. NPDC004549]|uniref:Rv3235 family protein n=1 Tax=Streptomyces sp. NPDC004549 TaxID=3154283 RepID=UPI0033B70A90